MLDIRMWSDWSLMVLMSRSAKATSAQYSLWIRSFHFKFNNLGWLKGQYNKYNKKHPSNGFKVVLVKDKLCKKEQWLIEHSIQGTTLRKIFACEFLG